ncbi:SGNH/GDSL hydrolase family protein [Streptomyces himalayensis]|uniref:SGNH/GDSL hydrolase family protein n=1 Tax=Streptomyces himalayensis subsp. himalayensis TaxID=2756131 RepID=A0A7W0DLX3_9ACTN|nr:SGNH/GDSL hydrolase family protein [Streptomyces himalayensis]MBA2946719.1 SGNH/GDSL hydrolase family protein [Streptomyces himalayensis subsp. himalayensis]
MRRRIWGPAALLALLGTVAPVVTVAPVASAEAATQAAPSEAAPGGRAEPLPLERLFDNRAVSDDARPGDADFDGSGGSLSAQDLTAAGWTRGRSLAVHGARLTWPRTAPGEPDNVRADGQSVRVPGRGDALAFLVAGTGGAAQGTGTVRYQDGSYSTYRLTAPDWRTGPLATKAVALPHINTPGGQLAEKARLYVVTVPVARGRAVASVELPRDNGPDLHVFALSVRATTEGWTGSWSASTSGYAAVGPWTDRTVRLVVHTSTGGPRVRIRLENTFAATPVRIGSATVAVQSAGAEARGEPVALSFRGAAGTEIPAGAQAFSDPLDFDVPADTNLLVSFHLPGTVTAAPLHSQAIQRSYVSEPGDHAADGSPAAYTSTISTWPLLTGVDVGGGSGSVVLLGDSITDGVRSTQDANRRWPDVLARRLLNQSAVPRYGVLNHGISANRVVTDRYPGDGVSTDTGGVSALHRLDRDVLAQTSVRTVVVFQGVNDVRWGASADQVIAGLREIAERARGRGLRVVGATIAPCQGESLCTASADAERVAVNAYIRDSGVFDAVLDFDAVLRDPAEPARMLAAYDSGDHLHPGDAGLKAIAESVDLGVLGP